MIDDASVTFGCLLKLNSIVRVGAWLVAGERQEVMALASGQVEHRFVHGDETSTPSGDMDGVSGVHEQVPVPLGSICELARCFQQLGHLERTSVTPSGCPSLVRIGIPETIRTWPSDLFVSLLRHVPEFVHAV